MDQQLFGLNTMSLSTRFIQLRKDNKLNQKDMREMIRIHITQVKRYEAGDAQPSIEILKKIATAFHVTTGWLIFDEEERELPDNLKLKLQAINQMNEDDQRTIQPIIDGMIVKHQTQQIVGNLSTA